MHKVPVCVAHHCVLSFERCMLRSSLRHPASHRLMERSLRGREGLGFPGAANPLCAQRLLVRSLRKCRRLSSQADELSSQGSHIHSQFVRHNFYHVMFCESCQQLICHCRFIKICKGFSKAVKESMSKLEPKEKKVQCCLYTYSDLQPVDAPCVTQQDVSRRLAAVAAKSIMHATGGDTRLMLLVNSAVRRAQVEDNGWVHVNGKVPSEKQPYSSNLRQRPEAAAAT